jgi:hypothetical protein
VNGGSGAGARKGGLPGLVNIQKTMEKSTIFDFDG